MERNTTTLDEWASESPTQYIIQLIRQQKTKRPLTRSRNKCVENRIIIRLLKVDITAQVTNKENKIIA